MCVDSEMLMRPGMPESSGDGKSKGSRWLVQGVKDKIGLKSSDVDQGLKICVHGQFHILNWFRRVALLRDHQDAVYCRNYTKEYAKIGVILNFLDFYFQKLFTGARWQLHPVRMCFLISFLRNATKYRDLQHWAMSIIQQVIHFFVLELACAGSLTHLIDSKVLGF